MPKQVAWGTEDNMEERQEAQAEEEQVWQQDDEEEIDELEKARRERKRRDTRKRLEQQNDIQRDMMRYSADPQYNGLLIDFLIRKRPHLRMGDYCKFLLDPPLDEIAGHPYADAVPIVLTEKLHSFLKRLVVYSYKNSGDPSWKHVTHCREHFRQVVGFKRESLALGCAVDNWNMMFRLRKAEGRDAKEGYELRRARLLGFWKQYHTSHKLVAPGKTDDDLVAATLYPKTAASPDSDECSSPKGPDRWDPWKVRPARRKTVIGGLSRTQSDLTSSTSLPDLTMSRQASDAMSSARTIRSNAESMSPVKSRPISGIPRSNHAMISKQRSQGRIAEKNNNSRRLPRTKDPITGVKIPKQVEQAFFLASSTLKPDCETFARSYDMLPLGSSRSRHQVSLPSISDALSEQALFGMPHRKGLNPEKASTSPTHLYLRACDDNLVLPALMPFCTGDSDTLDARGQAITDQDLKAVVGMFPNVTTIKEVDLQGNAALSEKSLVPFVKTLFGNCALKNLERFSIKQCLRNATGPGIQEVMDAVVSLIDRGVCNLKRLDLSGIPMGLRSHLSLCTAINEHKTLDTVSLAEVGLGRNPQVKECITELLNSITITTLDVSWNSFNSNVFSHLGERMVASDYIKTLSVANCSGASKGHNNPVEFFLECLAYDETLTSLDISLNRIDFRGGLVVEAALQENKQLTELNISNNPLCVLGFRSALRLLARDSCALTYFHCENCASGSIMEAAEEGYQIYSATNPSGRYLLNLTRPYDRGLLQMLYKTCERYNLPPEQAFEQVKVRSGKGYSHPSRSPDHGVWILPTSGSLDIIFGIEKAMESNLKGVPEADFSGFLRRHYEFIRVTPTENKMIALFALWKSIDGRDIEQLVMLDALSKDFLFTYPMLSEVCKSRSLIVEAAWRLLPCVRGGAPSQYLSMQLMPTLGDFLKLIQRSRTLLLFNIDNPTGHYKLDLANCCDYAVGEQLLLLDHWECSIGSRKGLEDTSQRGNNTQVRNETYQNKGLEGLGVRRISEFNMPEYGTLEFDYISSRRPEEDAVPINNDTFDNMLRAMHGTTCAPFEQIKAVTLVSHFFYLSALQMRALMGIFKETDVRAEFLVRLFLRLTDMYNEKIFRARFSDHHEVMRLQHRMGHTTFFPFIQPEQARFELNLAVHDQRLAMHILMSITCKEAYPNLRDYTYTLPDGTLVDLNMGIPRSWEVLDKLPKTGVFRAKYNSAPEDRVYKERQRLMSKYGFWKTPTENEVMWWSLIHECPTDVVEFVEFIYTRYGDIWKVFKIIDGEDGNGEITLVEFKEGLEEMKCKKFKGKNKEERIVNVFRYLDPSGEGQVSQGEWGVLEQILKEMKLSVKEFVQFCERTFGEDIMEAWDVLDADCSGEIDKDEWVGACNNLGFFGLTDPIFSFLDKRDVDAINQEDFLELKTFQEKRES